jgi:hypothetical protein
VNLIFDIKIYLRSNSTDAPQYVINNLINLLKGVSSSWGVGCEVVGSR